MKNLKSPIHFLSDAHSFVTLLFLKDKVRCLPSGNSPVTPRLASSAGCDQGLSMSIPEPGVACSCPVLSQPSGPGPIMATRMAWNLLQTSGQELVFLFVCCLLVLCVSNP